jgi:hypothetical protein
MRNLARSVPAPVPLQPSHPVGKNWGEDETSRFNSPRDRVDFLAEFSSEYPRHAREGRQSDLRFVAVVAIFPAGRRRRYGGRPDWRRYNICNLRGRGHRDSLACVPILACDVNSSGQELSRGTGGGSNGVGGADLPIAGITQENNLGHPAPAAAQQSCRSRSAREVCGSRHYMTRWPMER